MEDGVQDTHRVPPGGAILPWVLDGAYAGAAALSAPWLMWKFATDPRYRTGLRDRLGFPPGRPEGRPALWFHGVSVGEIATAAPLAEAFLARHPDWELILSTVTVTGQAVARRRHPGHRVVYFPLDFSGAVGRALNRLRPSAVIMLELELWPNFFLAAARRGIPIAIVNGRVTGRSLARYRWIRPVVRTALGAAAAVCAQSPAHAERYLALGAPPARVRVTGNMKFDGAPVPGTGAFEEGIVRTLGLRPGDAVWVGGSTHEPEERWLVGAWSGLRNRPGGLRLVLAPRHPERADAIVKEVANAGFPCYKATFLSAAAGPPADLRDAVLVVDTVGELRRLYGAATLAFVGGSLMPHGGQNMLEPAALGCPVLFGPHVDNFREISDGLLAAGAARRIGSPDELAPAVAALLADPAGLRVMADAGRRAVDEGRGATARNLEVIDSILSGRGAGAPSTG